MWTGVEGSEKEKEVKEMRRDKIYEQRKRKGGHKDENRE